MSRLIDADAVLDKSCWLKTYVPTRVVPLSIEIVYADELRNAPTIDAVPVVRCRECENWEKDWPPSGFNPDNPRYFCSVNDIFPTGDWFCADGKRREDGNV